MATWLFDTKDSLPEDLAEFATEIKDEGETKGKWAVNVVPRKKLEEFRDTNINVSKKAEDAESLAKKLLGILGISKPEDFDPTKTSEELNALKETARKVADGKLKASDDVDKVVAERTEVMRQKFDETLQEKQRELANALKARDEAIAAHKQTFVDRAVASVCNDADLGVEGTAVDDIMNRARAVFNVEADGTIIPKKNGQTLWGEDGSTPMSMKEWINLVLRKDAPHYFKRSNGGAATGGGDAKNFGGLTQDEFNKLPARRRLEIANEASFKAGR
jgi:NACalpha-BTF3-like transcription factor